METLHGGQGQSWGGESGRKSETPVYPELSLMPQNQRAQGLPLHTSHPPYFLSFKFPSAWVPGPQELSPEDLQPRGSPRVGRGSEVGAHHAHLIVV